MNRIKDWLNSWKPSQLVAVGLLALLAGALIGTNLWAIHLLDRDEAWLSFYEGGHK